MSILGQKGANLNQKMSQKGRGRIFPGLYINFPQEHHKTSTYTKNQQNSMSRLEDIGSNVDFGPKRGKFGPKRAQKGRGRIFPGTFTCLFHK